MTQVGAILESAKLALFGKASAAVAILSALVSFSPSALAVVKDLPGGPGVNQLNLPEPITRIAADRKSPNFGGEQLRKTSFMSQML